MKLSMSECVLHCDGDFVGQKIQGAGTSPRYDGAWPEICAVDEERCVGSCSEGLKRNRTLFRAFTPCILGISTV